VDRFIAAGLGARDAVSANVGAVHGGVGLSQEVVEVPARKIITSESVVAGVVAEGGQVGGAFDDTRELLVWPDTVSLDLLANVRGTSCACCREYSEFLSNNELEQVHAMSAVFVVGSVGEISNSGDVQIILGNGTSVLGDDEILTSREDHRRGRRLRNVESTIKVRVDQEQILDCTLETTVSWTTKSSSGRNLDCEVRCYEGTKGCNLLCDISGISEALTDFAKG